jgi:uncharacterized protein DUF4276
LIVQVLVEGAGDELAVPELVRRLQTECGAFNLTFDHPIRRKRADFVSEEGVRRAVRLARKRERGCEGILIVFDGDKDCPRTLAPRIREWVQIEEPRLPCEVVIAYREYEAWFLGALESLRGRRDVQQDAQSLSQPESVRGAKERLKASMARGAKYIEKVHQPAFTAVFDLAAAHRSCRSFRRMVRAFGLLAAAAGAEIGDWPPPSWL